MKKPIPFEEFVQHFTDQITRADRDFKLLQTYYHNQSDLYNLTPDGLGISEINIRLSLKRHRPCLLVRLFRKPPPVDLLKITPPRRRRVRGDHNHKKGECLSAARYYG